jgi:type IV pilus assembly protein PilA
MNLQKSQHGFSLTEMLVAVSIAGVLGGIAAPSFINQISKGQQAEAHSLITQVLGQTSAFNDEFGTPAEGWSDLDKIATILTSTGVATGNDFSAITTPKENYTLRGSRSGSKYLFSATPLTKSGAIPFENEDKPPMSEARYNIVACINVATGASDIQMGSGTSAAEQESLRCP